MRTDDFGDRMKSYEQIETGRHLDVHLPIYARLDGRAFHSFTRGMDRPFDVRLTDAMVETTKYLVGATNALIGYTQSDEISLLWLAERPESDVFFSGKLLKMVSVLASMAAAKFILSVPEGWRARMPHFDARVFQLPSKEEAANAILWRAMDARKNSIAMAAQAHFSSRQLHGKGRMEMLSMLADSDIDFETFDDRFKNGTFVRRVVGERLLTTQELDRIPESHRPSGPVMRSEVVELPMPLFNEVANRVGVIFEGEMPVRIERAAA